VPCPRSARAAAWATSAPGRRRCSAMNGPPLTTHFISTSTAASLYIAGHTLMAIAGDVPRSRVTVRPPRRRRLRASGLHRGLADGPPVAFLARAVAWHQAAASPVRARSPTMAGAIRRASSVIAAPSEGCAIGERGRAGHAPTAQRRASSVAPARGGVRRALGNLAPAPAGVSVHGCANTHRTRAAVSISGRLLPGFRDTARWATRTIPLRERARIRRAVWA
jgi:hypothetical protein